MRNIAERVINSDFLYFQTNTRNKALLMPHDFPKTYFGPQSLFFRMGRNVRFREVYLNIISRYLYLNFNRPSLHNLSTTFIQYGHCTISWIFLLLDSTRYRYHTVPYRTLQYRNVLYRTVRYRTIL